MISLIKLLLEQDGQEITFEDNPMQFILTKYTKLRANLVTIMGEDFENYLEAVFITSSKPTAFKLLLKNKQHFFMTYMGKGIYEATIAGKRYFLSSIADIQRATTALSRLLRYGPMLTGTPSGEESTATGETTSEEPETPEAEAPDAGA